MSVGVVLIGFLETSLFAGFEGEEVFELETTGELEREEHEHQGHHPQHKLVGLALPGVCRWEGHHLLLYPHAGTSKNG